MLTKFWPPMRPMTLNSYSRRYWNPRLYNARPQKSHQIHCQKMCLNKNLSASCKWIQHFQPNFCWVGPPYDFSLTWLQLRPWLQMQGIQPKTVWKQALNNMKVLGMPISDHQSNPPSCNGVSPGTFLVSTGKVTDTSQDQIQKPGSEEVRSVKWCWQKEKKIHTVGSNINLSMKLSAIFLSVIYLSIRVHLSSSFYLSICLSSMF